MIDRRSVLGTLALGGLSLATGNAYAQPSAYPTKPIRFIVPLPPGSPPDVLARIVGERLQAAWKQPVVVDNKPGATGMIGMDAVAKAAPDGYTMGILFLTHTVLPSLFGKVPYDTARDLAPVANLAWIYNVLVVPEGSAIRSLTNLVAHAKAAPGKLTFGSGGIGSPAHLLGETFCQTAGVRMLHVPFKGPSEAIQSVLGGQVDVMFATSSVAVPMVRGSKLRALAVTSPQRMTALPDVPTMPEAGMDGFTVREWEGVVGPAGVPAPIIERWNTELARIMGLPDVRSRLLELGLAAADQNSPREFGALINSELGYWTRLVKTAGIKAE